MSEHDPRDPGGYFAKRSQREELIGERGYGKPPRESDEGKSRGVLRWHQPCGLAVFDVDRHDELCPARSL